MTATEGASFDPETVRLLRTALEHACGSLPPDQQTPAFRSSAARAIIKFAAQGERDLAALSRHALAAIAAGALLESYDFEVLLGDETITMLPSVELPNLKALWPRIAELARRAYEPGCRIRVTDKSGAIVTLVGITTARLSLDANGLR